MTMEKTAHRTEFVEGDAVQTISRLSHLDEPPGQPIRHHELRGILTQHLQWLVSDKAAGRQADLSGAQLEEIDLTGADLEYAVMRKTNLGGADLFRAQLQHAFLAQANLARANLLSAELCCADLQGANFEGAAGLIFSQLAGANLRGAVLPTSMSESGAAAHVHQLAKRVATMLVALLSLCVLAMARIVTTTDIQLIRNSSAVPVLHLGNALPMMAFFLVTPVVLVGLCIALHLRLLRLWEAVEASPAVFPSGRRLANCGPWIVMALGFDQFKWIRGHSAVLSRFESAIAAFLAYWVPAVTLVVFWARYLTVQDLHGAILDAFLVVSAVALATFLPGPAGLHVLLSAKQAYSFRPLAANVPLSLRAAIVSGLGMIFALLSLGVIYGSPHSSASVTRARFGVAGPRDWAADVLWLIHLDPYANLAEQDVSTRPLHPDGPDDALAQTQGGRLHARSLRHAKAYGAFLAKAELGESDLRQADLSEADLRYADLHRSSLRWAVLDHAQLFHAKLEDSDLRGASLFGADLHEANISFASLGDANLNRARLDLSSLYRADLHAAQFVEANLEGADLREANLDRAVLARADLQNSYLSSAKLTGTDLTRAQLAHALLMQADLRHANLRGADLRGATLADSILSGANLDGADLRGASGLTVEQVCSAHIDSETQLDDSLALQVNDHCPLR